MTRINAIRSIATRKSVTWGKGLATKHVGAFIFAAVLIVCSLTVGCSSNNDQPKPVSSNNQIPVTQSASPISSTPAATLLAETKPAPKPVKKIVHKKPATANYTDQTYGLTFEYPRRYAIETGNAATELLAENPIAMNFLQPGGVALAAVELPETSFANSDFSSAFFNVSVNKNVTADQCTEFAVPQPKPPASSEPAMASTSSTEAAKQDSPKSETQSASAQPTLSTDPNSVDAKADQARTDQKSSANPTTNVAPYSMLMLGDLELHATEAVSGEGTRQSDSKYFHVFQNGACYEFALNVTTVASGQGVTRHVDRDKVFNRLEQILSTVKINPVATAEVTAEGPTPTSPSTPAQ
ncbi:MAG TPA: hypothetical protein VGM18_11795 [Candidatus Sulfotelmatobacter sp.]|jgi:hypothetical protein